MLVIGTLLHTNGLQGSPGEERAGARLVSPPAPWREGSETANANKLDETWTEEEKDVYDLCCEAQADTF